MRFLYTVIYYFLLPFILLRLWIKNWKTHTALKFWYERLGIGLRAVPQHGIWVYAVSVGESIAAVPLIKELRQRYPNLPLTVTNETIGGAERIYASLGTRVAQLYSPYDLPFILKKFFKTLQPRLLILMETELWPNLLAACRHYNVPVLVANARLSNQSAKGYRRISPITKEMLRGINRVAAQSPADAERFIALGLPYDQVSIVGSIKFDLEFPPDLVEQAKQLRAMWGRNRLVWIAASTHQGEEEQILDAFAYIRKNMAHVLLVVVPRHINRVSHLENLCLARGYNIVKRSENICCTSTTDIFIGDTIGELLVFYAAADLAFIGGSLVKKGGQNPLEPAAVGLPLLTGPYTCNFDLITQQLKQRGIEIQVNNAQELAEQVLVLFAHPKKRQQMGNEAKKFVIENKGSLMKHLQLIEELLT
jgi:3-deoxy-D-manno-octulosonic-acid transferase